METSAAARSWLVPLYAGTLFIQAIAFVLRPTAVYRAIELEVPAHWLGMIGASFAIVPLGVALVSGRAVDRLGEPIVMRTGAAWTVLGCIGFLVFGNSVGGLLVACVALGLGHLCSVVAQQALVANHTAREHYDTAFGRYTFVASAGQAIGPGLIVIFGGHAAIPDTEAIFAWTVPMSVALVVAALLVRGPKRAPRPPRGADAGSVRTLLARPGTVRALTVSCIVLAAVDITIVYLPALGAERDIPAGVVGALLAVRAGASMISRFALGRLAAWFGRVRLLTVSVAMSSVAIALVPVPMPTWSLFVVVAVAGLGLGTGQPLTMSWLADATPAGLRGRAMSLRLTGNRLGQVVAPSLAGLVAVGAGVGGVLWLTAGALAAATFGVRRITESTPPPTS